MNKLVICLLILIIGLSLGMGVACASENINTHHSTDESQMEIENTGVLSSNEDNALKKSSSGFEANLKASNNPALAANEESNFTELQELINANYGGTLVLDKNYTNNDGFNPEGILINGSITIDGKNNILNGKNQGRIFYINASNVILKNIQFINGGHIWSNGGAIYWNGDNGRLSDSTFTNNSANDYGGAVYWYGNNGCLSESKFNDNSANNDNYHSYGGAVSWYGDKGVLSDSTFTNNTAENAGGAVYWTGLEGVLSGSSFEGNNASTGGAVTWHGDNGTLSDSNFTDNFVTSDVLQDYVFGGAVYWLGNYGVLSDSSFINNSANDYGGAVYWQGVNGVLSGSSFINNSARFGGAVTWYEDNGTLSDSNFTYNSVNGIVFFDQVFGGAVHWLGNYGVLSDSTFTGNNCSINGGAVSWYGGNGVLSDSSFINNSANDYGGAVYWNGDNGRLSDSSFINNSAEGDGGAVTWFGAKGTLSDSTFTSNTAEFGGAVYWNNEGVLSGSSFINNSAELGGAVCWYGDNGCLNGSNFNNNSAGYGGAVSWYGGNGTLNDSTFTGNNCSINGGAVYWNGDNGRLCDSSFINNSAEFGGAVYKIHSTNLVITNTVFGRNKANSDKIIIEVEGNETSNVTVKITFYGNDNIANAIWNCDDMESVKLANISCEFSYDGSEREYKTFNKYDAPKAIQSDYYVEGSDELWQSPLEDAQVLDINITDSNGNIIYSIVNGRETKSSNAEMNLLRAFKSADNNPLNLTDVEGKILIKLTDFKVGDYKVSAKHSDDDYYTNASNDDSFVILHQSWVIAKDVTVNYGEKIAVDVSSENTIEINYNIVDENAGVVASGVLKPGENIYLNGLPAGKYTVKYVTVVDDYHISANATSSIVVEKLLTHVNIDAPEIKMGEDAVITVIVPEDATGNVTIEIEGKSYTEPVRNGKAVFYISGLKVGSYDIKAYYSGDNNYSPNNATGSIDVLPSDKPESGKTSAEDKSGLAKYETGNPIVVLLMVLSLLGISIRRRK